MKPFLLFLVCIVASVWGMAVVNRVTKEQRYGSFLHIFQVAALYGTTWGPFAYLLEIIKAGAPVLSWVFFVIFIVLGIFVLGHTFGVPMGMAKKITTLVLGLVFASAVHGFLRANLL